MLDNEIINLIIEEEKKKKQKHNEHVIYIHDEQYDHLEETQSYSGSVEIIQII